METEVFGAVFWIPDGQAPESDTSMLIGFSPAEANRVPNPDSSLIEIKSVQFYAGSAPSYYSPDAVAANLSRLYGEKELLGSDWGLTSIRSSEYPDHLPDWYRLGTNDSTFITCLGSDETSVCRNFVDLKDKHLFVSFLSTLRAVRHNALTISTLRDLLQEWEAAY